MPTRSRMTAVYESMPSRAVSRRARGGGQSRRGRRPVRDRGGCRREGNRGVARRSCRAGRRRGGGGGQWSLRGVRGGRVGEIVVVESSSVPDACTQRVRSGPSLRTWTDARSGPRVVYSADPFRHDPIRSTMRPGRPGCPGCPGGCILVRIPHREPKRVPQHLQDPLPANLFIEFRQSDPVFVKQGLGVGHQLRNTPSEAGWRCQVDLEFGFDP